MLMDSGNSSSMQSNSSNGDHDQEYDSRSFNPPAPLPPQPFFSTQDPTFLHPFSDFPDPDFINWPNPVPDPNYSSFPVTGAGSTASAAALPPPPAKNPKKRTRASRRAPTTVLTTDTSNFRAMVQEFTGIPAPPLSGTFAGMLPYRQRMQSQSQLNMGGQSQQMGFPGQPDPILQSLIQQQTSRVVGYRPDQSPPRSVARLNAAFGEGGNNIRNDNMLFSNSNNVD